MVFEPPAVLSTTFTSVRCAGCAVFVIVHVALPPGASATFAPFCVPPVQDHALAVEPGCVCSVRAYEPALTVALVTATAPLIPVIGVGPVPVNGKSAIVFEPPLVLSTTLTSVRCAG